MEGEVFVAYFSFYFVCRQDIVQGKLVFMQTFADKSSIILV